jgi:hypothetical protein
MNSRRLIASPEAQARSIVAVQVRAVKGRARCPLWVKSGHVRRNAIGKLANETGSDIPSPEEKVRESKRK